MPFTQHGGSVGQMIYQSERSSLLNLWKCSCAPLDSAERGNLPVRCDADWFADTFCAGKQASNEEEVWKSVEAVNLYRCVGTFCFRSFVIPINYIFSSYRDFLFIPVLSHCWRHFQEKH
jgi:hypothetical protein